MLCCTLLYGVDLCSRFVHVCISPKNSMSCLLAAFAYNIHNVSVVFLVCIYSIFFFLLVILQCTETLHICCSIILCYIWSNHLPCRMWYIVFQILQVKCHTVFIESFAFLCIISCLLMYDS